MSVSYSENRKLPDEFIRPTFDSLLLSFIVHDPAQIMQMRCVFEYNHYFYDGIY